MKPWNFVVMWLIRNWWKYALAAALVAAIAALAWHNASREERAAREAAAAGSICEGGSFSDCVFARLSPEGYVFLADVGGAYGERRIEVTVSSGAVEDYLNRRNK